MSKFATDGRKYIDQERTLGQPCTSTSGLAQHARARRADNYSLGMREDGGDGEAAYKRTRKT